MDEENPLNLPKYYRTPCCMRCGQWAYPYKIAFDPIGKTEQAYYKCPKGHSSWSLSTLLIEQNKDKPYEF